MPVLLQAGEGAYIHSDCCLFQVRIQVPAFIENEQSLYVSLSLIPANYKQVLRSFVH